MPACRRTTSFTHRPGVAATTLAAALLLAGCADTAPRDAGPLPVTATTDPAEDATEPVTGAGYPVTVDNCGTEVTVATPPERIVAIKSSAIEMVLALGAGDRLVATAFPDGPVPPEYADAAADLTVLSEQVPSAEAVLETEPDLVYAGWESNLSAEGAGERSALADLGVATYVSPSACKDPAYQPDRLTFDDVFAEIIEVADLLGVPDAAESLVAAQQEVLDGIDPDDRGLTALWYSSGNDVPYVGAGIGAPQMIMEAAGLTNVAADVQDTWTSFGWEQIVADDPDVLVLVDSAWNSAEHKRELLATNPVTANLDAVRHERYVVLPFASTEAGVRNVHAVRDVVDQLAELDVTG